MTETPKCECATEFGHDKCCGLCLTALRRAANSLDNFQSRFSRMTPGQREAFIRTAASGPEVSG